MHRLSRLSNQEKYKTKQNEIFISFVLELLMSLNFPETVAYKS